MSDEVFPPLGCGYPGSVLKRWLMPNVLIMPAFEFGHPMAFFVLMKAGDPTQH